MDAQYFDHKGLKRKLRSLNEEEWAYLRNNPDLLRLLIAKYIIPSKQV